MLQFSNRRNRRGRIERSRSYGCSRRSIGRKRSSSNLFGTDPDFIEADRIRDESGCVLRYERTFMRPLLPGDPTD